MRIILACLLCVILLIFNAKPVSATNYNFGDVSGGQVNEALNNTTPVRFLPDNPLYLVIRAKELISRFFKASSVDRARFDYILSSKRLKEAYLLLERGNTNKVTSSLDSYSRQLAKTTRQLEKAQSQNQEIRPEVDWISANLIYEQVLLVAITNANVGADTRVAVDSFKNFVTSLEKSKPGLGDRFNLTSN